MPVTIDGDNQPSGNPAATIAARLRSRAHAEAEQTSHASLSDGHYAAALSAHSTDAAAMSEHERSPGFYSSPASTANVDAIPANSAGPFFLTPGRHVITIAEASPGSTQAPSSGPHSMLRGSTSPAQAAEKVLQLAEKAAQQQTDPAGIASYTASNKIESISHSKHAYMAYKANTPHLQQGDACKRYIDTLVNDAREGAKACGDQLHLRALQTSKLTNKDLKANV